MKRDKRMLFGMVLGIVLAMGALLAANFAGVWAQSPAVEPIAAADSGSLPRTITVIGEGSAFGTPDMARVNVGLETEGNNVLTATEENSETMTAILTALKEQGVAAKDMQTAGYNIWVDRNQQRAVAMAAGEGDPKPELYAEAEELAVYRVTNTVQVVVRDLDNLGEVLDAALNAGANRVNGISYLIAEPEELIAEARANAVEDAQARAAALAELNDVEVGQVVAISEVVDGGVSPVYEMAKVASGSGPFTSGESELTMRLKVVYEIR